MHNKEKARWQAGRGITRTRIVDRLRAWIKRAVVRAVYWQVLPPSWADCALKFLQSKGPRHEN